MTLLYFGTQTRLSPGEQGLLWLAAALLLAGVSAAVLRLLNRRWSLDALFLGPGFGRFWAWAALALVLLWTAELFSVFRPGRVYGLRYWPLRAPEGGALLYAARAALWGAAAFWTASEEGRRTRSAAAGAACGLGAALAGLCAHRWLFLADALGRTGVPLTGNSLIALQPLALAATVAALALLALRGDLLGRRARAAGLAAAALAWTVPAGVCGAWLSRSWDYGAKDLAEAARLRPAERAPELGVVVLARPDGSAGSVHSRRALAVDGLDASPASLRAVERYLDSRGGRSLFAAEALTLLRKGWAANWEPRRLMRACLMSAGAAPPDFLCFLDAVGVAPVTADNFSLLEDAGAEAFRSRIGRADRAQKTYEGFSAAYAHFGDLEGSNAWLGKVGALWPLYGEDVRVEPVVEVHDGRISGEVYLGRRPGRMKVGLFVLRSTAAVADAGAGLVDARRPDSDGAFRFLRLAPGRYYLALSGPELAGRGWRAVNAPGVVELSAERRRVRLPPIALQ